jgi:DNA-binding protein H-NS
MAKPNVDKLSFKELAELTKAAETRMASLRDQSIVELQKDIIKQVEDEGFTIEEVIDIKTFKKLNKKPKTKLPPKYRNPNNKDETYVGRGPKPQWLKDLEDSGRDKKEFLIEKS